MQVQRVVHLLWHRLVEALGGFEMMLHEAPVHSMVLFPDGSVQVYIGNTRSPKGGHEYPNMREDRQPVLSAFDFSVYLHERLSPVNAHQYFTFPGFGDSLYQIIYPQAEMEERWDKWGEDSTMLVRLLGGPLHPLQLHIQFFRQPAPEQREKLAEYLRRWYESARRGIGDEGPLGEMSEIRFKRKEADFEVDWGRASQLAINYLVMVLYAYDQEVALLRKVVLGSKEATEKTAAQTRQPALRGPAHEDTPRKDGAMGNFYVNISLRGPRQRQVADYLALQGRRAFVSPTVNDITVVFDEAADMQDPAVISALAEDLSRRFACPALAVLNHDDGLLWYRLYVNGQLRDEYDSCPSFSDPSASDQPAGGDTGILAGAFAVEGAEQRIETILRPPPEEGFVDAMEQHRELARALSLPSFVVGGGYMYLSHHELPPGLDEYLLVQVGER